MTNNDEAWPGQKWEAGLGGWEQPAAPVQDRELENSLRLCTS